MKMHRGVLLLLMGFFISSCATTGKFDTSPGYVTESPPRPPFAGPATPERVAPAPPAPPIQENVLTPSDGATAQTPFLPSKPAGGKSGVIDVSPNKRDIQRPVPADKERRRVVFEFDKADVTEVTNKIFQDYLKLNYVLDPTLQGRISLYIEGEFTNAELLDLVTKAYAANLVSVVPRGKVYLIQPLQRTASTGLPIAGEFFLKKADEYEQTVIVMYKLRFLEAKQAVNTIRMFLAPGRPLTVDDFSNSIIFAEDSGNARTIVNILKALDMNIMKELGMEVIPLQSLSAEEAATSVDALLGKMDVFKAGALQANVAVVPLQHFGGVLVLAQDPEVLSTVKNWLRALDLQGAESGDQIHVYYVQNSLAVEIASILGQMYGMEGAQATGRRSDRQLVGATGRDRRTTNQTRDQRGDLQQQRTGRQQQQTGGAGGAVTTTMTGAVIIVPDETNNAIVIRANQVDYAKIKRSIQALDIVPRGVLIEVMIAEVRLTDELQYGVEWLLKRKGMDIGGREGRYTTMLDTGTQATVDTDLTLTTDAAARGLSFFWGSVDGDISALINLLGSETDVTILSNPTLLATDNKEASITVGGREPIVTQQATDLTGDTSTIVNSVQYEETGIILSVIPHINAGGLVRMEVEQTIRDAVANTISGIDSPRFTERKINTTMIAQNGNTVVIGGIIQTTNDKSNTGIPYLNKIPILSPLFSSKSNTTDRTELIIAITPRVVTHDRRDTTSKEFYERLMQLKRRIEREGAGGI